MGQRAADLFLFACLSVFCHFTPSVFSPSLFLAIFVVLHIYRALPLFSCAFRISGLPLFLSLFCFFALLSVRISLSFARCDVKRLTNSGLTVSEMIGFAGEALLSVYPRCKVRHLPTRRDLRGTRISKEPLGFELVSESSQVLSNPGVVLRRR